MKTPILHTSLLLSGSAVAPNASTLPNLLFILANGLSEKHDRATQQRQRVHDMASELTRVLQRHRAPMPIVTSTGEPVPWPAQTLSKP